MMTLQEIVGKLRAGEPHLRQWGVRHAAVFGSVARGENKDTSDIDILIELDPKTPMGMFQYARLKIDIAELVGGPADVVNRRTVRPMLRDAILREAVDAF
jgi:predicted nucleotidyltransferase